MVARMVREFIVFVMLWVCLAGAEVEAKSFDWPKKDGFEFENLREIEKNFKASQDNGGKGVKNDEEKDKE